MNKEIQMTCIVCPQGCRLKVVVDETTGEFQVFNNKCNRGPLYAKKELTNPTRFLTATVAIKNGFHNRLPVKSSIEIPKNLNFAMMDVINKTEVQAPIKAGQVIIENILETGIDIVATRDMEAKNQ